MAQHSSWQIVIIENNIRPVVVVWYTTIVEEEEEEDYNRQWKTSSQQQANMLHFIKHSVNSLTQSYKHCQVTQFNDITTIITGSYHSQRISTIASYPQKFLVYVFCFPLKKKKKNLCEVSCAANVSWLEVFLVFISRFEKNNKKEWRLSPASPVFLRRTTLAGESKVSDRKVP